MGMDKCMSVMCTSAMSCFPVQANVDVQAAGVVVNTMGFIEGLGYELLLHSIETLKADVVLVVGNERLYNQLKNHLR